MATIMFGCEACGDEVDSEAVKYCKRCETKNERSISCRVCGNDFDPFSGSNEYDTSICCALEILKDFYSGRELTTEQERWALGEGGGATEPQRQIALALQANLTEVHQTAGWPEPRSTNWETKSGASVTIDFSGGFMNKVDMPVTGLVISYWEREGMSLERVYEVFGGLN